MIKMRTKINDFENRKSTRKSMKPKAGIQKDQ